MENVSIIGVGQTPVGEHWDLSLRHLGLRAMQAALADAALEEVDAIIVGNALGGVVSNQNHLGALLADFAGLRGVEAVRIEAADASGGLALHQGYLMVASGLVQTVMVLGVEKVTDVVGSDRNTALATFLDTDYEAANGATPVGMAALIMRRYMHEYGVQLAEFANFSVNAHANGAKNEYAMFRNLIKADRFAGAPIVADPVNLFDVAPEADGADAVILTLTERAADMVPQTDRILASEKEIGLARQLPISTFGGRKSRGNPLGATGVYQAVEAALQLRGQGGANQVANAEIAMTQNLGGIGSTAVTHLFGK